MSANMTDYELTMRDFSHEVPAKFNFARDVIDRWAETPSDAIQLLALGAKRPVVISYRQLAETSGLLAAGLQKSGIEPGDTIIVMLGRKLQWWETITACLRMGAVVSPATPQLSSADIEYRIQEAGVSCIITDSTNREKVDAISDCPGLKLKVLVDEACDGWQKYSELLNSAGADAATVDTDASAEAPA